MQTTWKYNVCVPYVDNFTNGMDSDFKKNWVGVGEGGFYPQHGGGESTPHHPAPYAADPS